MDLHLNDIALYVEVARRGNISRAARVLNMPASTLTRRVDGLERQLGMRLLSRNRQGVVQAMVNGPDEEREVRRR
jgi:DNA-binding transcriptional LysR family regulator